MYKKVSGIWKEFLSAHKKISGAWKAMITGYKRVSGVWKIIFSFGSSLPENIICFVDGTTPTGTILCDGNNSTIDLIGKYLKVATAQGISDSGSNVHSHVYSGNSGYCPTVGSDDGTRYRRMSKHYHTISHTHSDTNHEPQYKNLAPCLPDEKILSTMLLFFDGATIPTGWSQVNTYNGKFIRGGEDGLTGGSDTHTHVYSGYTGYKDSYKTSNDEDLGVGSRYNHRHTMNHTHGATNNIPEYYDLRLIKPDSDTGEIPSGVCAFFLGSVIPDGWSYFSTAEGKFIRANASEGGTGGSNTHTHTYSGMSGGFNPSNVDCESGGSDLPTDGTHYHSINHTHGTTDNIPLHRELLFCKKD